jgi:hypothetical protein
MERGEGKKRKSWNQSERGVRRARVGGETRARGEDHFIN